MQLFKLKGNYSEGFGNEPHKNQWRNKDKAAGASQASEQEQEEDVCIQANDATPENDQQE